jgi:hypothetical protein
MAQDIEVPIVRTELKENMLRAVPLVDYFLYEIFALIQSKPNWPLVRLPSRVTVNLQLHRCEPSGNSIFQEQE